MFATQTSYPRPKINDLRPWLLNSAAQFAQQDRQDIAQKLSQCHDGVHYVMQRLCSADPTHPRQLVPYGCRLSICPICTSYRANRWVRQYGEFLFHCVRHAPQNYRLHHIVLTTPVGLGCDDMLAELRFFWAAAGKTMDSCLRVLRKNRLTDYERKQWRIQWNSHRAGYLIAADWGEQNGKLHFHVLYFGPRCPRALLRDQWRKHTRCADYVRLEQVGTSQGNINRTISYIARLAPVPEQYAPLLYDVLQSGIRRRRQRGIFLGLKIPKQAAQLQCEHCCAPLVIAPLDAADSYPAAG